MPIDWGHSATALLNRFWAPSDARKPQAWVGTATVRHTIDVSPNVYTVHDTEDRAYRLVRIDVHLTSGSETVDPIVTTDFFGRRLTKAGEVDKRSEVAMIPSLDDSPGEICDDLGISLDPEVIVAQAFPKH